MVERALLSPKDITDPIPHTNLNPIQTAYYPRRREMNVRFFASNRRFEPTSVLRTLGEAFGTVSHLELLNVFIH